MSDQEFQLAISSLQVRKAMNLDCVKVTTGNRKQHYIAQLQQINAELKLLEDQHANRL